jgi:hypothetical protein
LLDLLASMLRMRHSQVHNLLIIVFPVIKKKIIFFYLAQDFQFSNPTENFFIFFHSQNRFYQKTRPKYPFRHFSNLVTFGKIINRIKMITLIIVCDVFCRLRNFYHFSGYQKNSTLKKIFLFWLGQGFQFSNPTENFFIFLSPKSILSKNTIKVCVRRYFKPRDFRHNNKQNKKNHAYYRLRRFTYIAIFIIFPVIKKNLFFLFSPRFSIFKSYGKLFYFFIPKIDFIKKHDQSTHFATFQTS